MYEKLMCQLRACMDANIPCEEANCGYKPFSKDEDCIDNLMHRAVNAIEELSKLNNNKVFGTWEWDPDGIDWGIGAWKCSNCGSKAETWWAKDGNSNPLKCAGSHYCGNCGATMRR